MLRWATSIALATAWFNFLAPTGLGGPVGLVWVSGTSMEPSLRTGDLAVTYRSPRYERGDTVAFEIPEGGTVIHRIIEITDEGYRFQGDNRDFADPWVLREDAITGRQVLRVPRAATIASMLGRPSVMSALVMVLSMLWWSGRTRPGAQRSPGPSSPITRTPAIATTRSTAAPLVRPARTARPTGGLADPRPAERAPDTWRDPSGFPGGSVALQLAITLLNEAAWEPERRPLGSRGHNRRTSAGRPVLP